MNQDDNYRLTELEKRVERLEKYFTVPSAVGTKGKRQSAKEFLLSKDPGAETKKVLTLGYFLEHVEGMSSFNVGDLEAVFRSAKEKLPKNMNDAVNKNIASGFFMEAETKKDAKKAWHLTSTGERYVEDKMSK
jgi:hypothetical protein